MGHDLIGPSGIRLASRRDHASCPIRGNHYVLGHEGTKSADGNDVNVPRAIYRVVQRTDNVSLVLLDAGIVAASWLLAFVAGFESAIPGDVETHAVLILGVPVLIQVLVHRMAGLYGPVWRYASIEEGVRVIGAVVVGVTSCFGSILSFLSAT